MSGECRPVLHELSGGFPQGISSECGRICTSDAGGAVSDVCCVICDMCVCVCVMCVCL